MPSLNAMMTKMTTKMRENIYFYTVPRLEQCCDYIIRSMTQ